MKVPFVDLRAGVQAHREEYLRAITAVVDSAYFAGGPEVLAFEEEFASFCGAKQAVAVSTGTDALVLALRGLGVGPGDEVITAPNSFFATAEAISHTGATPVFADVDDATLLLDPAKAEAAVTERTKAIVPVHLFGQVADMPAFRELCSRRGLALLEDSAQAHGAMRDGVRAGSAGDVAGFSFYPAKNLGAFGEGGAITTSSEELATKLRQLRDHGQSKKHVHNLIGYNARLPALLCAALRVSLRHLEEATAGRRRAADRYRERLAEVDGVRLIEVAGNSQPVYHLFVVRVSGREGVAAKLAESEISTAVHYPTPIHLQPAYASLGLGRGAFPVAESACDSILSLPMYPELSEEAVDHVCGALTGAVS